MYATRYGHTATVEYLLQNGHEDYEISRVGTSGDMVISAQMGCRFLKKPKLIIAIMLFSNLVIE